MKKLLLMCGIPGSGKSTLAKKICENTPNSVHISRDIIRFNLLENTPEYVKAFTGRETATTEEQRRVIQDNYFSKEKKVYQEFIRQIKEGLTNYDLTIADASHINEASRNKLLRALGTSLKDVEVDIMVVKVPFDLAVAQNNLRKNTITFVPSEVLNAMNKSMTMPTKEEGFDNIYIYEREI